GAITFRLPVRPPSGSRNYYHATARIHQEVLERLRAIPGVEAAEAASTSGFPVTPVPSFYNVRLAVADRAADSSREWPYAELSFATPGYFRAMGIPLPQGRTFRWEDTGRESHGVILSASLARALFDREVDPKLLITQIGTLETLVDVSMARARLTMMLLLVAAATALGLAVTGIYGVLSYAVSRRTAELGVRIALGARPAAVVRMVVRQGALLTLAGIGLGVVGAVLLTRYLRALLYGVSPTDPVAFAAMAGLLLALALAASYLPARRAARVDPMVALRSE